MFPNANIVTELSQASNMRFMQFSAQDIYSQKVSHLEQVIFFEKIFFNILLKVYLYLHVLPWSMNLFQWWWFHKV